MEQFEIKFKFVHVVSQYDVDVDLYCGSYCVDAKSILGIMTMDLRNPMWITANCDRHQGERMMRELDWVAA